MNFFPEKIRVYRYLFCTFFYFFSSCKNVCMVRCLFSSNCFFLRSFSFSSSWVSTSPKTTAGRGCKTEPQTGHGTPSFKLLARIPACAQKNFSFSVSYSTTACFASLISVFNCSCNFSFSVWRSQSIFSFFIFCLYFQTFRFQTLYFFVFSFILFRLFLFLS